MNIYNIPIHRVCRNFDRNCIKTLKLGKFSVLFHFRCQFEICSIRKTAIISSYLFLEDYWTTRSYLVECFQHSNLPTISTKKLTKIALKRKKLELFANFLIFGSFWPPWGHLKKSRNLHKYISHEA